MKKEKHNTKDSYPKVCTRCADKGIETTLNPGVNCYQSMYSNHAYICKPCKKAQSMAEHETYWKMPDFRERKNKWLWAYHREEPAGVYAVYDKDEIIYIGESKHPIQRRTYHFSKHIQRNKDNWQSQIQHHLMSGKLKREDLSFDIMEYEQDKKLRKQKEVKALEAHKLAFGDYPKYNIYFTDKEAKKKR